MAQVYLQPGETYVSVDPNAQVFQQTGQGNVLVGSGTGTFGDTSLLYRDQSFKPSGTAGSTTTATLTGSARTPPPPPKLTGVARTAPTSANVVVPPSYVSQALTTATSSQPLNVFGGTGPVTAVSAGGAPATDEEKRSAWAARQRFSSTGDGTGNAQQQALEKAKRYSGSTFSPEEALMGYVRPEDRDAVKEALFYRTGSVGSKHAQDTWLMGLTRGENINSIVNKIRGMVPGTVYLNGIAYADGDPEYNDLYLAPKNEQTPVSNAQANIPVGAQADRTINAVPQAMQTGDASQFAYINDLYKTYLGRDASLPELQAYANIFGPTVEPNEIAEFIRGAVTSGEITNREAANLFATLPGGGITGGGGIGGIGGGDLGQLPSIEGSNIDPLIGPYLKEALEKSRSLFLGTPGPQLYPEQMYVSPSEQTLQALTQAERIATSPEAQALSMQGLQAYQGALGGLSSMARGDYLQSPEYQRYLESVTRPVTEQVTQQILPSIASQYSAAGRYGSGAMQQATGRATEFGARALGDITSQVAQQQQGRMLEAQTSLPNFLGQMPSVLQGSLAPSTALAGIGAQREAIAGQPLQESIRRFEYGQQLPYNQLAGYLSSIYGSPLGVRTGQPEMQGNTTLQNIGGLLNTVAAIPGAVNTVRSGINFLGGLRF